MTSVPLSICSPQQIGKTSKPGRLCTLNANLCLISRLWLIVRCTWDANARDGYHLDLFKLFSRRLVNNHCILDVQLDCKLSTAAVSFWGRVYFIYWLKGKKGVNSQEEMILYQLREESDLLLKRSSISWGKGMKNIFLSKTDVISEV